MKIQAKFKKEVPKSVKTLKFLIFVIRECKSSKKALNEFNITTKKKDNKLIKI